MQRNPLTLIITVASFVLSGLCCLFGVGFSMYVSFAARSAASSPEPVVAYASPSTPAYPVPDYPVPEAPMAPSPRPALQPASAQLAITADTPTRGPADAPITIHVVSEFQCPFCARVEPTLAQLDAANPGRIRWVWHDYPLPFHQNAMPAAEAAREVRRQLGDAAFWRFHDMLFESQRDLSGPTLERLAGQMPGLDLGAFRGALASRVHEPAIRAQMAQVEAAQAGGGVGTPCFLVQGRWLRGAQPLDAFQRAIDQR